MNIDRQNWTRITLSESEVKEAITTYITLKGYKPTKNEYSFNTHNECRVYVENKDE